MPNSFNCTNTIIIEGNSRMRVYLGIPLVQSKPETFLEQVPSRKATKLVKEGQ